MLHYLVFYKQRWSRGPNARGQGQALKKQIEAKDQLFEDRPSLSQKQKCSRPRPRTRDSISLWQVFREISGYLQKTKVFVQDAAIELTDWKFSLILVRLVSFSTNQKLALSSS